MKRVLSLLPKDLRQKVRDVVEFRGGVVDHYLNRARETDTEWEKRRRYRLPPGAQPQPVLPSREFVGPGSRYNITFYTRDNKRDHLNQDLSLEESLKIGSRTLPEEILRIADGERDSVAHQDLSAAGVEDNLVNSGAQPNARPPNPDVDRYDRFGTRTSQTASPEGLKREAGLVEPSHLPQPDWLLDVEDRIADSQARGMDPFDGTQLRAGFATRFRNNKWEWNPRDV